MQLNSFAKVLITAFQKNHTSPKHGSSSVNPLVTEMASWYERFRNAVEYREEEMILRASIERILKRILALGDNKDAGKHLVRELVWAQYIAEENVTDTMIEEVSQSIHLHLALKKSVHTQKALSESTLSTFIFHILSSHIEDIISPSTEREKIENYIFFVLSKNITIEDDPEAKNAQLFIAIKKAYSKNDLALLEYHLFKQYFGELTDDSFHETVRNFKDGFNTIKSHLNHPLRHRILNYVKRQIPPFLILEDMLRQNPQSLSVLEKDEGEFHEHIRQSCQTRYASIAKKVRRAVIRSIIFIALSKVFFGFAVEATYDNLFHGQIYWLQLGVNIFAPILLMVIIGFLIRIPGEKNTSEIIRRITHLLTDSEPTVGKKLMIRKDTKKERGALYSLFTILWISGFLLSFGVIAYLLTTFGFTVVSQGIFIFFLSIVSFLAYRINQTAQTYTVIERQNLFTPIVDLFFMPIARVGRHLTEGISQINIFLFILDFLIETPYKGLVAFFEQWFFFLHSKRDDIG